MTRFAFPMIVALGACAGSETGNGANEHRVDIEMVAFNALPRLAATDVDGVDFDIADAIASVERLDFILPGGESCTARLERSRPGTIVGAEAYDAECDDDDQRLRVLGPWVVDLVTGAFDPPLGTLVLPAGAYARIEATMRPGDPDDGLVAVGSVLDGATFFVSGTVLIARDTRHYTLTLDFNEKAKFAADTALTLDAASDIALLLDVRTWFSELPLAACISAGDVPIDAGVFQLDQAERSCANVGARVRAAIKDAGKIDKVKTPKPVR